MPVACALEALIYLVAISFLRIALIKERGEIRTLKSVATDQLTGAASRRTFFDEGPLALKNAAARNREASLLIVDIDHFKTINDQWGHACGDEVLREFVRRAQDAVGRHILFARLGGEEFAVLLPGLKSKEAFNIAQNLRAAISSQAFVVDGQTINVTISLGLTHSGLSGHCLETMLRDADTALYHAKRNGRDRIECVAMNAPEAARLAA